MVQAVRAEERTPVTKTDIGREAIDLVNRGQEMPFLLGTTPSVNFQSDSGLAAGYAYFNIRGIGQTRLNITLDGVPLQDPEDQALYFSNFGDFASVVDSIQVQRGVGTSSVGAASYGGSVNFASVSPADRRGLEAQVGGGSWGTGRGTLAGNSGLLGGAWGLYARALGPDDRRLPGALRRRPGHGLLRRHALGRALALQALRLLRPRADPARLPRHRRGDARDGPARERALARRRRTASARTSSRRSTRASWARRRRSWPRATTTAPRAGSASGTPATRTSSSTGSTATSSASCSGATHRAGRLGLNWGAHANDFTRDHFMDVVGGSRAYLNTGPKNEYNTFLKATWDAGRARLWADAQVRRARFEYRGDQPLGSVSWTFFNPKAGVRFDPSPTLGLYASVGRMGREPARSDMLNGEDNATCPTTSRPWSPSGWWTPRRESSCGGAASSGRANVYAMEFDNEIALTGELREIGLPVRRNAGRSHRRGVELDLAWRPRRAGGCGDGRAQPQPDRVLDAVLRRVRRRRHVGGERPVVHHDVAPLLTPPRSSTARSSGSRAGGGPARGRALGRRGAARQHRQPGLPHPVLLQPRRAGERLARALGEARRAADPGAGHEPARRPPPLAVRLQLPLLRPRRPGATPSRARAYYYPLATRSVYVTLDVRF